MNCFGMNRLLIIFCLCGVVANIVAKEPSKLQELRDRVRVCNAAIISYDQSKTKQLVGYFSLQNPGSLVAALCTYVLQEKKNDFRAKDLVEAFEAQLKTKFPHVYPALFAQWGYDAQQDEQKDPIAFVLRKNVLKSYDVFNKIVFLAVVYDVLIRRGEYEARSEVLASLHNEICGMLKKDIPGLVKLNVCSELEQDASKIANTKDFWLFMAIASATTVVWLIGRHFWPKKKGPDVVPSQQRRIGELRGELDRARTDLTEVQAHASGAAQQARANGERIDNVRIDLGNMHNTLNVIRRDLSDCKDQLIRVGFRSPVKA